MQADFLEYAPEGVIVHVLIDDLRGVRIAEAFQRFLHVVPLEFDARGVHETEFLMHVPGDMTDPIVIKPILGEL